MKKLIVFILLALFFVSCISENPIPPVQTQDSVKDYFPLKVGNYWIYEYYVADSTQIFINQNITDSLYVEKDSLLNGKVYKVLRSSVLHDLFLIRDSADCLVLADGQKMFTLNQNIEILAKEYLPENDTSYVLIWKMNNKDSICNLSIGQYPAKYVLGKLNSTTPNNPYYNERNLFYAYSKNIGLLSRRICFLGLEIYIEERLLRYNVSN